MSTTRIAVMPALARPAAYLADRKSTRLNSSHANISYAVFCLKKSDHPVHLARVFRVQEKQTRGDYVQRSRVRSACVLLRNPEICLACVAADCGCAYQTRITRP